MTPFYYTLTSDSVTVIDPNSSDRKFTLSAGDPNYYTIRADILRRATAQTPQHTWEELFSLASPSQGILAALVEVEGFSMSVDRGVIFYDGQPVPHEFSSYLQGLNKKGTSILGWLRFYARLQQNPSWRVVQGLGKFLSAKNLAITEQGTFLAWKGVQQNFRDCHSGKIDNRPVALIEEPRNRVSDDPSHHCHFGLHAGTRHYAGGYGNVLLLVEVSPADVVCVPNDTAEKLRMCRYISLTSGAKEVPMLCDAEKFVAPDQREKYRELRDRAFPLRGVMPEQYQPSTRSSSEEAKEAEEKAAAAEEDRKAAAKQAQQVEPIGDDDDLAEIRAELLRKIEEIEGKLVSPPPAPTEEAPASGDEWRASLKTAMEKLGLHPQSQRYNVDTSQLWDILNVLEDTLFLDKHLRPLAKALGMKNIKGIRGGKAGLIKAIEAFLNGWED